MYSNLPNLFVLGAAKSGTTTLYSILAKHPEIFMSYPKATGFFNKKRFTNGLDWYLENFFRESEKFKIRGEATPSYLANAEYTAPNIKTLSNNKKIKFITIFRNPIERAYSHYWYNYNKKPKGKEILSFEEAIEFEKQQKLKKSNIISGTRSYLTNGEYSRCLSEYFKYFNQSQFLFLLTEDLKQNKFNETTKLIFNFLEVEPKPIQYVKENQSRKVGRRRSVQFINKNRNFVNLIKSYLPNNIQNALKRYHQKHTSKTVQYPPMKEKTHKMLLEKYIPEINELETILHRDLSHWKV